MRLAITPQPMWFLMRNNAVCFQICNYFNCSTIMSSGRQEASRTIFGKVMGLSRSHVALKVTITPIDLDSRASDKFFQDFLLITSG
jgi:hypothetical protein